MKMKQNLLEFDKIMEMIDVNPLESVTVCFWCKCHRPLFLCMYLKM